MDNNNNNQTDGKFFNGFLLGLLVGAFVVFLLGTKKGKKLLKAISEGGQDNISDILDKSVDLDEAVEEEIVPKREIRFKETIEKPKVRRFFTGTRRVN